MAQDTDRGSATGSIQAPRGPSGWVAVAASGGRDSTALLHATMRQARLLGLGVVALHVHHGLQTDADEWARRLTRQCRRWAASGWPVQVVVHRLPGRPEPGESVEAWARAARHRALQELATQAGASLLLLAHHQEDQAETFLLQALRGQGAAGLASMPARQWRGGLCWARPWLGQPRAAIESYLARWRLHHSEDGSNQDPRFDRNRLRRAVWPALATAFPGAGEQLGRSARLVALAAEVQQEVARADWLACRTEDDARADPKGGHALHRSRLLQLSPARQRGVLRAWLGSGQGALPERVLDVVCEALPLASNARSWDLGQGWQLRLHRDLLWHERVGAPLSSSRVATLRPRDCPLTLPFGPGRVSVPAWAGHLELTAIGQGGVLLAQLRSAGSLSLRPRQGREQWRASPQRPARSLKKQFQGQGVSVWDRDGPLLWCGDQLVWVPGLGLDARWRCPDDRPGQVEFRWLPARGAA